MRVSRKQTGFITEVGVFAGLGIIVIACGSHQGGIEDPGSGGSTASGGRAGAGNGGASAGKDPLVHDAGASGTADEAGMGGANGAGENAGGSTSTAGSNGSSPPPTNTVCHFHTDPPAYDASNLLSGGTGGAGALEGSSGDSSEGGSSAESGGTSGSGGKGAASEGGEGGTATQPTITIRSNGIVGQYLADAAGKSLYFYGRDLPGNCDNLPISNCYDDCVASWPLFDPVPREVVAELDATLFGRIERMDGTFQATYRGWPLYYYKTDVKAGDVLGHGKGPWWLAEVVPPNITSLRFGQGESEVRTLADEFGHTLYKYTEDTVGTETSSPVSACNGSCLENFHPFSLRSLAPVTLLDPLNFSVFVRGDGTLQVAYKGSPLYFSPADQRSGDLKGLDTEGWTWAAP